MSLITTIRKWEVDRRIDGLFAIERDLRALLDSRLAPLGITYAQFSLLRFIGEPFGSDGRSLGRTPIAVDVADHFGFTSRTVTVSVNALVKKGWVVRKRSAADKRCVCLEVTSSGKEILATAQPIYHTVNRLFINAPRQQATSFDYIVPRLLEGIRSMRRRDEIRKRKSMRE